MQAQPTAGSRDRAGEALADVLSILDDPEHLAENVAVATIAGMLNPDAPCRRWSLGNRLLMVRAGTHDARGFRQWQAVGRNVQKGARAFHILAPKTIQKTETDPDTGKETKRPILVGFTAVPVFAYSATDGEDIGYEDAFSPDVLPPLSDVAERLGVSVTYVPTAATLGQNALGWYQHSSKAIVLGVKNDEVFWHELAHAAHYEAGLAQDTDLRRKEIVAETVAAVIARLYGRPIQRRQHSYLASYAGPDVSKAALSVLTHIEQVLDVLFPRTEGAAA